jgi:hypothetical protein
MAFWSRIGNWVAAASLAASLAGCGNAPSYPTLPVGDVIGQRTLTPKEQEAEIKSLSDAQVATTQAADPAPEPQYIPASASTP